MSVPVNSVQSLVRPTDLRMRLGQLARLLFSFAGLAFYPESVRRGRKKRTIRVRGQCPANPRIDLSVASLRNVCASRVSTWRLSLSLSDRSFIYDDKKVAGRIGRAMMTTTISRVAQHDGQGYVVATTTGANVRSERDERNRVVECDATFN